MIRPMIESMMAGVGAAHGRHFGADAPAAAIGPPAASAAEKKPDDAGASKPKKPDDHELD